jgi:hypothetical protein
LANDPRIQRISIKQHTSDVFISTLNSDDLEKIPQIVMPDLIRHPERVDITEFRLSPE